MSSQLRRAKANVTLKRHSSSANDWGVRITIRRGGRKREAENSAKGSAAVSAE